MNFEKSNKSRKNYSYKEVKLKIAHFCAYQERSQKEVRNRLYEYGLQKNEIEELIVELITDNFINEERFAQAYVSGKFRQNSWGRVKILEGLKQHNISPYCTKKGLQEIEDDTYLETVRKLIQNKKKTLRSDSAFSTKQKIARYLIQKGYEPEIVWSELKGLTMM